MQLQQPETEALSTRTSSSSSTSDQSSSAPSNEQQPPPRLGVQILGTVLRLGDAQPLGPTIALSSELAGLARELLTRCAPVDSALLLPPTEANEPLAMPLAMPETVQTETQTQAADAVDASHRLSVSVQTNTKMHDYGVAWHPMPVQLPAQTETHADASPARERPALRRKQTLADLENALEPVRYQLGM